MSIPSSSASVATTASRSPAGEVRLDLAALLRRVAGPVGGDPLGELGRAQLLEPHAGEALDQLDPAAAAQEADRPQPLVTRSASSSAASESTERRVIDALVDHGRVPHRDPRAGPRRAVGVDQRERLPDQPLGELDRVGDRRRGQHEAGLGAVDGARPAAGGAARWRRASRRRRGRCAPRRRRPSRGWRGSRPSPCGGAGPRC